ncbi:RecT-like single-strand DNA annealing protein [Marinitoga phage MPV1]|uniref:Recombinational DNA repair protein (RecE pathway) n=1 Tax=Marinitoga piezophila (strain DSM 14283 / JCM 11233 / KA3) TaxID=443254 RepID=H2J424_MARPK|nr:RecT family recombinase [Marinitoga piezophila]AEX84752.1 recombinational DNA repair protein (RecE pathway) [Marinitoga piezophila KA3]
MTESVQMENVQKDITPKKSYSEIVLERVKELEKEGVIQFPPNYSYANALKSAWLMLKSMTDKNGKPVLQSCTKESITNSLLDMVIQGLSPAKKQCYFIPYGNKLQLQRSYFGTVAVIKRLKGVKNVFANIIYEGDEFEYTIDLETGVYKIIKHKQDFRNIDPHKILGAYAVIVTEDDQPNYVEIMNINQIKDSWNQGKMKGNSNAHKIFTDQMVKKTVINRACKMFVNTSDDSDLLIEAFNKTTENEYENSQEPEPVFEEIEAETIQEIKENANKKVLVIEESQEHETLQEEIKEEVKDKKQEQTSATKRVHQKLFAEDPGF